MNLVILIGMLVGMSLLKSLFICSVKYTLLISGTATVICVLAVAFG